ncbi:tRNA (adenine(22)-N(1))-methyltransferase [Heyndrickxia acidiproducens]|uniref:tRNA (adenine(22)-N(1))-methyltransferase n=1 Tax=Heyndrickxia acidiproducens TaxID=1121084 RepID=UPI0003746DC5|nr:tRNA (adenine(22)-N(1))-methyltransferase TrmK [Heyndrickxia acidiproducens]
MNSEKLSKRLAAVAAYIPKQARLADIGSDHAYLPCYCVKNGIADRAIAGEVVEGPYRSALNRVEKAGLKHKIAVRKGNGLEVLSPQEADCITIAGMGGSLITSILERGKAKLSGVKRLVLQPNVGAVFVRRWCAENGWQIVHEEILEEDGKIYEIIVADAVGERRPYQLPAAELLMGPFLIKEKNQAFRKKWTAEKRKWQHILESMSEAHTNAELADKKKELLHAISLVEEVLQ